MARRKKNRYSSTCVLGINDHTPQELNGIESTVAYANLSKSDDVYLIMISTRSGYTWVTNYSCPDSYLSCPDFRIEKIFRYPVKISEQLAMLKKLYE